MNRPVNIRMLIVLACVHCIFSVTGSAAFADATMVRLSAEACPAFEDDLSLSRLSDAVTASIDYYRKLPADRVIAYGKDKYTAGRLARGLTRFRAFIQTAPSPIALQAFMKKHGAVYAHMESRKTVDVLFTGYYEPELAGSRVRSKQFPHPVYPRPRDLVTIDSGSKDDKIGRYSGKSLIPYFDRKAIDTADVLSGRAVPIAWVSDPIGLFFLHVQGSGKIRFDTGELINVHYDITNGLPYRSIGKYLIDKGALKKEEVSMQTIRDYIVAHPEEQEEIFHYNPRYVFFRTRSHGAVGCLGVPLTPMRSVALDRKIGPAGSLLFIKTEKPVCNPAGEVEKWITFSRFAVNQDTGSAIQGPMRADIFWGSGDYAETAAGYLKHPGKMYYVVITP